MTKLDSTAPENQELVDTVSAMVLNGQATEDEAQNLIENWDELVAENFGPDTNLNTEGYTIEEIAIELLIAEDRSDPTGLEVELALNELGWSFHETGGGCTAFERFIGDDHYLLITDFDGNAPLDPDQEVLVGFYTVDHSEMLVGWKVQLNKILDKTFDIYLL